MTGYDLTKYWFNMVWESPELSGNHTALYLWICEIWNRLGHPEQFQITSQECMRGMSAKTYKTYKKCLDDLIEIGVVKMVKKSTNQYQCNIIGLVKNDKAKYKALSKALTNAVAEAPTKPLPIFIKPQTTNHKPQTVSPTATFNFRDFLIDAGASIALADDWIKVRKQKKGTQTETALKHFLREVEKSGLSVDEVLRICIIKNWVGFESTWSYDRPVKNSEKTERDDSW